MLYANERSKIASAGKRVYLGYLLLDILNDKKGDYFTLDGKRGLSLNEYVTELVKSRTPSQSIKIGKKDCKICLIKNPDNTHQVKITSDLAHESNLKPKDKYNDSDFLDLCNEHKLTFSCNENGRYAFSTKIGDHIIGGPGKIDLYPIHIANLYQMIKHIESGKNINTLVAMATGSGKSFTQALLALVLEMVGYRGVFAVHRDSLVNQLREDFNRLLPTSITDKLCQSIDSNSHIITTHDILFREKSNEFKELLKNDRYWICIDEAHNAAKVELYKKGIEELNTPIFFLTATPSEFITKKVGCVVNLSPKEKEKLGISKSDIKIKKETKSRVGKATGVNFLERLALWFTNFIEKERLSPAYELIDNIEESVVYRKSTDSFCVQNDEVKKCIRWNTHLPIGKKLLALVGRGSEESVINFHLKLHGSDITGSDTNEAYEKLYSMKHFYDLDQIDYNSRQKLVESTYNAYEDGNKTSRLTTYALFGLFLLSKHRMFLDGAYLREYEESKKELRKASLCNYLMDQHKLSSDTAKSFVEQNVDYSSNAAKYQEFNVLHGIIENTISYLTGYDSITLNHKRRHDLDSLVAEVREKLSAETIEGHKDQILVNLVSEGIPESVAEDIAEQEFKVLKVLKNSQTDDDFFKAMIDNWSLDKKIHDQYNTTVEHEYEVLEGSQGGFSIVDSRSRDEEIRSTQDGSLSDLQPFCKQHKTVFMVIGMQKAITKENRPFFNLRERSFKLNAEGNDELKSRTKHKYSTIERLDDTILQYYYEPDYCPEEYTEEVIDKLFKKGLIGSYITSEKTTGFNDPNLCNVGVVVNKIDENINNPDELVQSDRNRKLDWAEQPFYFIATRQGVKASFNVNELTRGNYIPALNKARRKYNKELVKRLGSKIAEQIQDYISDNTDPLGRVDFNRLENKLTETIWKEYEDLYNQNNHDSKKTKEDFIRALNDTYEILYSYEKSIKENYKLPVLSRVITFVLELITKIIYWFKSHSPKELEKEIKKLEASKDLKNKRTYVHILQNYKYKDIISSGAALNQLAKLAEAKVKGSEDFIIDNLQEFIKEKRKAEFDKLNQLIKELLSQLITATDLNARQKEEITKLINKKDCWLNRETFNHINNITDLRNIIANQGSDTMLDVIASDTTIRQYLEKEKITKENFNLNNFSVLATITQSASLQNLPIAQELFDDYENMINRNDGSYKVIDKSKCEEYLTQSIAHYFQSDTYRKLLNYFILPLKKEHLLTIIDAIHPQDKGNNNQQKLAQIQKFIKGVNNKEKFAEIVKNCGSIEGTINVQKYMGEIIQEVLDCHCYYHDIDEKGMHNSMIGDDRKAPKLLRDGNHEILDKKGNSSDFIECAYSKMQFIGGTLKSLSDVSEIDYLDNKDKIEHMKTAAEELKLFIKSLKNPNKKHEMKEIEKIASKLSKLQPLEGLNYYNAVQQARNSLNLL